LKRTKAEQRLLKTIVVLIRNTTWRCGKLERVIVAHLHRKSNHYGNPQMSIDEMLTKFNLQGKKKNEFLDAIKRLERRNIVRVLT
jgi:hypothetical protein